MTSPPPPAACNNWDAIFSQVPLITQEVSPMHKHPLSPTQLRRVPSQFSWVDQRLVGRVPPGCGYIQEACPATVKRAKRYRREGHHGIPVALSPLGTPSTQGVQAHVVCSGRLTVLLPTTLRTHTPTGWSHGGTRKSSTS